MLRGLILSVTLSAAVPAIGQVSSGPGSSQAGASTSPQSATTAPTDTVASIVDSEFPAYDANGDGQLDKTEFSRWMVALKDQEMKSRGEKLSAADVTAWADGAFKTADADKSTSVSKPELITYLSRGAA
ncbi:EF-hand domain-containing protein [Sphingobium sp. Cam5-1]|uniref:EF-hand domain-containing protein n=1 Tax=Sphingobium sp. Cam5-1 TaxID=2789327 RepID=UPI0018AD1DE5|nr:EF-hand domain-containing protein [Sphingobium sp. Cam5-1]QPI74259.1 EF-hand domain-containing protein [Sphingobium sp. Cam5-1]